MNRRKFIRTTAGVAGAGVVAQSLNLILPSKVRAEDPPPSPTTTPWVTPLPAPPAPKPDSTTLGGVQVSYTLCAEAAQVQVHPDFNGTATIWRYRDENTTEWPYLLGPIFQERVGRSASVTFENKLSMYHTGFGVPKLTVHHHGGHQPACHDGYPVDIPGIQLQCADSPFGIGQPAVFGPGAARTYYYPFKDAGHDKNERGGNDWYHDHLLDHTSENVWRGLAGMIKLYDAEWDTNDEETGLKLPSGEYDLPLVLQDKRFDATGELIFDPFEFNGNLGDKLMVNGAITPFMDVEPRPYRFRVLNASNARFWLVTLAQPTGRTLNRITRIGNDTGLLSKAFPGQTSFEIGMAERVDIVIDFRGFEGKTLYLENRYEQTNGRRPDKVLSRGPQFLQFRVGAKSTLRKPYGVDNARAIPSTLRPLARTPAAELAAAELVEFKIGRSGGLWVINNETVDLENPQFVFKLNQPYRIRFINSSGGWWHPMHIHSDFFRILRRSSGPLPPWEVDGVAKKDTVLLHDSEEVDVFIKFRDYPGDYVFHCHNLEHEDHAMMAGIRVVP